MIREAWWAAVHWVAQSRTWLKQLSMYEYIGEGNGNPLQYSCLENPRDRGAWCAVYGVTQSQTRLKRLSSSSRQLLKTQWTEYSIPAHFMLIKSILKSARKDPTTYSTVPSRDRFYMQMLWYLLGMWKPLRLSLYIKSLYIYQRVFHIFCSASLCHPWDFLKYVTLKSEPDNQLPLLHSD